MALQGRISSVGAKAAFVDPGSPWGNGTVESLNGKLRDEPLGMEVSDTLCDARAPIEQWRRHCNVARPHASLGCQPSAPEVIVLDMPMPPGRPGPIGSPPPPATTLH